MPDGGGPDSGPGLIPPKPTLNFLPPDLWTSVDAGTAGLQVTSDLEKVTDKQKTVLTSYFSLRSWPDLSEISAATSIDSTMEKGSLADRFDVDIMPSTPLVEGWYFLSLLEVPQGFDLHPSQSLHEASDGSIGTRFRIGSEPLLLGIAVCPKEAEKSRVYFHFSELIKVTKAMDMIITLSQTDGSFQGCDPSSGSPGGDYERYFDCVGLDMTSPLTIIVGEGIQSMTGVPMKDLTGKTAFTYLFTPASLSEYLSGCGFYRPEESLFSEQ